jgi:CheY-like chemotaxis protein
VRDSLASESDSQEVVNVLPIDNLKRLPNNKRILIVDD